VFTARYGLIPYMKHITFRLLKVNIQQFLHKNYVSELYETVWEIAERVSVTAGGTYGPWLRLLPVGCDAMYLVGTHQIFNANADPRFRGTTSMLRITTFWSTTDRIYDGGPIILYYIIYNICIVL